MKTRMKIAGACCVAALVCAPALAEEAYVEIVRAQLDAMLGQLQQNAADGNATATEAATFENLLASDTGHVYELQTNPNASYAVVAACDSDCGDIDLIVTDQDGGVIAADETETDVPVLIFDTDETSAFSATVNLYDCAADTCYYGVRLVALEANS